MKQYVVALTLLQLFFLTLPRVSYAQDRDVEFQLNENGFKTIIEQIERQLLDGDGLKPIPDVSGVIKEKIKFNLKGVKYAAKLDDFEITPEKGYLNIALGVNKAYVQADIVDFETEIFGQTIRSTCINVGMSFENEIATTLTGQVGGTVEDEKIKLFVQNVSYDFTRDDIKVIGPEKCTGHFGSGFLIKFILRTFLRRTRTLLESELQKIFVNIMQLIEEPLNDYVQQTFKIDLEGLGPIPALTLFIITKPHSVTIDTDGLKFAMDTNVDVEKRVPSRVMKRAEVPGQELIGYTGINPEMVSEALTVVFPEGVGYLELNKYVPALNEYLTTATASVVWPFLINEDLQSNYLKVFVRVNKIPQLSVNESEDGFSIEIPDLRVKFQVHKGDRWQDFFEMRAHIQANASAMIGQRRLSFTLDERNDYVVEGYFIGNYGQQADVEYDQEMSDLLLGGALDFIHGAAPFIGIDIPITDIAGLKVSAGDVFYDEKFVRVGIVKSE